MVETPFPIIRPWKFDGRGSATLEKPGWKTCFQQPGCIAGLITETMVIFNTG
jgi:hypothetical protein